MTAKGNIFSHKIFYCEIDKAWKFKDNLEIVSETYLNRKCGLCMRDRTKQGHDPCIANLANVKNACCGHGDIEDAYVQFYDKPSKYKSDALYYFLTNKYINDKT